MTQRAGISACNWVCWLIGVGAGVLGYWVAMGAVPVLPALLVGLAVGAFVGLVLSDLICGNATDGAEAVAATGAEVEAEAAEKTAARRIETAKAVAVVEQQVAMAEAETPDDGAGEPEYGTQPEMLDSPKGGDADDLKKIKGVGPKLETLLNHLGVYHFAQIAGWNASEVAWVDDNLKGFKGRVSRDNWVDQAKILAEHEETEFSARVGKGEVY